MRIIMVAASLLLASSVISTFAAEQENAPAPSQAQAAPVPVSHYEIQRLQITDCSASCSSIQVARHVPVMDMNVSFVSWL